MTRRQAMQLTARAMDPPTVVFDRVARAAILWAEAQKSAAEAELATLNATGEFASDAIAKELKEVARMVESMRHDIASLGALVGAFIPLEIERLTAAPLAKQRSPQLAAIRRINEGREVTTEMRAEIVAIDKELAKEFPVKSHRHEEIDRRQGWKRGRARYIIEGPRKSKKK